MHQMCSPDPSIHPKLRFRLPSRLLESFPATPFTVSSGHKRDHCLQCCAITTRTLVVPRFLVWKEILKYVYIIWYTWNPNDPSFDWSLGLIFVGFKPQNTKNKEFQVCIPLTCQFHDHHQRLFQPSEVPKLLRYTELAAEEMTAVELRKLRSFRPPDTRG